MPREVVSNSKRNDRLTFIGISLIVVGFLLFLDSLLTSSVILYIIFCCLCVISIIFGLKKKRFLPLMGGVIVFFSGISFFFGFSKFIQLDTSVRIGLAFLSFGISWLILFIISALFLKIVKFWLLLPGMSIAALGLTFAYSSTSFLDIMVTVTCSLSLSLLIWGFYRKSIGLIIPSCLIGSSGLGVFIAWRSTIEEIHPLARVGIMLVIFALGWGLITVFSRRVTSEFMWWPLIPACVIGVTGLGLYIGGNQSGARKFIGNTGSITLIIFGLYILLLRRGFTK